MFNVAAYTNVGTVKSANQDSCCLEVARTPYGDTAIISVCDGVGGLASGEVASSSVVRWLVTWFEQRYSKLLDAFHGNIDALLDHVQADWDAGIKTLNDTLRLHGRRTNQRMGSTCTVALFYNGAYIVGHVGDTRLYDIENGVLAQITQDQTWVAREVLRGTITPEEARSHPRRNVILQSVGTQEEIQPVFTRGSYHTGKTYMVCCDGFRNELFDAEIVEAFNNVVNEDEAAQFAAMESLANLVMQRGERDNITAVTLSCCEGDDYGESVIEYTAGLATLVAPEEDASPTGFLGGAEESAAAPEPETAPEDSYDDEILVIAPDAPLSMESTIGDRYRVVSQPTEADPASAWIALDNETSVLTSLHETVLSGGQDEQRKLAEHVVRDVNLRRQINNQCVDRPVALAANSQTIVELIPHVNTNSLLAMVEETQGGMSVQDVITWGTQLSRLLSSLHSMRPAIMCCDLRPQNLMVGEDGIVRVADLDRIRFYRAGTGVNSEPETVRGYSAPEAFMNGTAIDPRADVYQLGATLFHLATGESPTTYANRLKLPVASRVNPNDPKELSEVIAKATRLDPDDRYQTAEDLTIALEAVELAQDEGSGE